MKTRKKIVSILLVFMLLISLVPTALAAESSYQDTKGHWAEAAIERWSDYGVIQGNNGSFNPNGSLTRAHMAAVLSRLLNLPEAPDAGFADVKAGDWHAEYINKCAAAGIMLGTDGKANPNAPITRQQAIVMMARALGIKPVENPDLSHFQDGSNVSDYAKGYVAAMNEAGIVGGVTTDTLAGGSDITRAATVTILSRAITTYANEAGATVEAAGSGIVLVAADNVTVTGKADSVLVAQGVSDGGVTLKDATVSSTVTVKAENVTVAVAGESKVGEVTVAQDAAGTTVAVEKNAAVGTVTTEAPKSTVSVSGKVDTVATTETAEKASVEVAKNATVGEIAASGEKTEIAVSGKVDSVTVADTAADTTVKANSGSTISKVDNAAEGTTVSGSGKVENVTTSGDNTTVSTPGTKVEASEGTSGTTAGGKDVAGGSSSTTQPSTPSGGGSSGGGGSTAPSHSHSYATAWSYDATHHWHAATCYHDVVSAKAEHTYVNCVCSVCGFDADATYIATAAELKAFRDAVNSGTFAGGTAVLTADIDLNNEAWTPIGTAEHPFEGTFDGQGHKISDLTNAADATSFGLFEKLQGTVAIKNFELTVNAVATNREAEGWAGVVGLSNGAICDLTLENITVKGTLTAKDKAAGLIAQAPTYQNNGSKLTVKNCVNEATVTGDRAAGICCAINTDAGNTFIDCVNKGDLVANDAAGRKYYTAAGIVCKNEAGTVFTNCSNRGGIDAKIGYTIATKVLITFTSGEREASRVREGDTYWYTQKNYPLDSLYNLFVGEPYSPAMAVDWEEVVRTSTQVDYIGLGAGIWYDTEHKDDYKVAVNAWYHPSSPASPYELTTKRYFKTIDEAFAHDLSNATITLLDNQTLAAPKEGQMTYTIDLGGKTLTANSTIHNSINGGTITIKNGTIVQASDVKLFEITNKGTLKLENVTIASEGKCIARIAASYTGTITFDENCSISGYIDLSGNPATKVVINGTTYSQPDGRYVYIDNNDVSYGFTKISTPEQLKVFAADVNNGTDYSGKIIKLTADINLAGEEWAPIGTAEHPFSGTIDGNGKTITGLTYDGTEEVPFGLIAYGTGNVTVKNIKFENVAISSAGEYAAAVMALYIGRVGDDTATYAVNFENITVSGEIFADDKAAAILGCNYSSDYVGSNKTITVTFDNCVNNADISGKGRNGGIAGAISGQFYDDLEGTGAWLKNEIKVVFNNCENNGTVASNSATYKTGGIVGFVGSNGNYEFNDCSSTGTADGDLFGRFHYAGGGGSVQPTSNPWDGVGLENGFGYLTFNPQVLTIYDCYSWRSINVYWQWKFGEGYHANSAIYYVSENVLADDEWRLTIDGTHYRAPFNTPIDGTADCTPDTAHLNNALPTADNWSNNDYGLTINGNQYTYTKEATGGQ